MNRNFRTDRTQAPEDAAPSEAWLFAQAILGKPIPDPAAKAKQACAEREQLEWLAQISTTHAEQLRRLQSAEAEARHQRELLEWLAQISTEHAAKLRRLKVEEYEAQEAQQRWEHYYQDYSAAIIEWNEVDHPRAPKGQPDGGQWVGTGGGGGAGTVSGTAGDVLAANSPGNREGKSQTNRSRNHSDSSRWYLPSEEKGTWLGEKGKSTFRLKTPVEVNGKLVHEIQYIGGIPVLDKFALPGKTATIILTGDRNADIRNAEVAWRKLNPGQKLPKNATFHHDLLHVVEETVEIDGKKTKVLVGKMQLIPTKVNAIVFHQGSASVAKHFYNGLDIDVAGVKKLAKDEASLAARGGKYVAAAAKKIVPGKIAKAVLPFVGRNVVRAIPLIGTGLAIVEFADNVEAHGIGGAVVRATPLLGDLVSAYDLGSDLAKQITDEANAAVDDHTAALNAPVTDAWKKASEQTIEAFQDLASRIQVTNVYGPSGVVDPDEVATALKIYRGRMQQANLLKSENAPGFDFDAAAAEAKRGLKERLTRAAQKDSPPAGGPLL